MFYNFRKNKKAFTLVELIVVIAIIAILGAVVGVTVATFVNRAKKTAASSPLSDLAANWENKEAKQTLLSYLEELFPDTTKRAALKISSQDVLTHSNLKDDTFKLYFHNDDCGDYYGVLQITKGKVDGDVQVKDSSTTSDAAITTEYGNAKAIQKKS